jgi:hypothetical protein
LALFGRRPPYRVDRPSFRQPKTCTEAVICAHVGDKSSLVQLALASGLASVRAQSMKSFATGLTVRFLNVEIATGHGLCWSNRTGKALMPQRLAAKCSTELGKIDK